MTVKPSDEVDRQPAINVTDRRAASRGSSSPAPREKRVIKVPPPWWDVFIEFEKERFRQMEKWGDQRGRHADGTGLDVFRDEAIGYQINNDARAEAGEQAVWADILLEEVFEALSEDDLDALAQELIQVGAVVTGWLEDLAYRKERQ